MLVFYDAPYSGNTWKVRLLLRQLEIPHQVVKLDLFKGEARTPGFRARNPFGRVPFITEDDDFSLSESNAILLHLSRGSFLLPADPRSLAHVHEWMFFEQNQLELNIGLPRIFRKAQPAEAERLDSYFRPRAVSALKVLERHLASREWLAGSYSVADIALCAYTQLAPDAGHDLAAYPSVSAWLARIRAQPGFIELE
ncbi:MAG: glutathione S-transferase family protein [Myxococcales bacterium]|nr:glutathione S-transferase family protein [Myxococcales bacterium]